MAGLVPAIHALAAKEGVDARHKAGHDDREVELMTKANRTKDWRGAMLARIRKLIRKTDPDIVEEVKWRKPSNPAGVPVWSHDGIVCTGETYKDKVKVTFANGAKLKDKLFNAGLGGGTRRAIDFFEGDTINERGFKALVRAAVEFNMEKAAGKKKRS
jgi:hypothetical protein